MGGKRDRASCVLRHDLGFRRQERYPFDVEDDLDRTPPSCGQRNVPSSRVLPQRQRVFSVAIQHRDAADHIVESRELDRSYGGVRHAEDHARSLPERGAGGRVQLRPRLLCGEYCPREERRETTELHDPVGHHPSMWTALLPLLSESLPHRGLVSLIMWAQVNSMSKSRRSRPVVPTRKSNLTMAQS